MPQNQIFYQHWIVFFFGWQPCWELYLRLNFWYDGQNFLRSLLQNIFWLKPHYCEVPPQFFLGPLLSMLSLISMIPPCPQKLWELEQGIDHPFFEIPLIMMYFLQYLSILGVSFIWALISRTEASKEPMCFICNNFSLRQFLLFRCEPFN